MGSSAKKKKEKKKDFQKPKLKVGKTKPKAENFTSTSFQAKSIVLKQQSLAVTAPSTSSQFLHHLSLLTSKSDTQRRDSLAYLTSTIAATPPGTPLPQPAPTIISIVEPMLTHPSNGVRQQALKLLISLPHTDIKSHVERLVLRTQAGMTNLSNDIRSFALDVLEWLLETAGDEVVCSPGGWAKTLDCFIGLLGLKKDAKASWTSTRTISSSGGGEKLYAKQLQTLALFVRVGLADRRDASAKGAAREDAWFPLRNTEQHMLPKVSNPYGYLNLFGIPRNDKTAMSEDVDDRRRIFVSTSQPTIMAAIYQAKGEGGEVGRAAAQLKKAVAGVMKGFDDI
ncbi:hypothetical protein K402DRAFT_346539 [Aulographum hederae CBS 113979]|uniref:Pre-rRNA-processing protein n=1 Tax=Aulographum hederae CBS 113979 TaxID=1176131 RepID=A0A6G1HEJ9_9PEZI|nr:hypothetical protein K402DRAFT_346539 [Aulographum hederae CBS 113979]